MICDVHFGDTRTSFMTANKKCRQTTILRNKHPLHLPLLPHPDFHPAIPYTRRFAHPLSRGQARSRLHARLARFRRRRQRRPNLPPPRSIQGPHLRHRPRRTRRERGHGTDPALRRTCGDGVLDRHLTDATGVWTQGEKGHTNSEMVIARWACIVVYSLPFLTPNRNVFLTSLRSS